MATAVYRNRHRDTDGIERRGPLDPGLASRVAGRGGTTSRRAATNPKDRLAWSQRRGTLGATPMIIIIANSRCVLAIIITTGRLP